jgi:tetratricopeptide (TPR) repeat protein/transcriptional regulator with XRE-family HTH domain
VGARHSAASEGFGTLLRGYRLAAGLSQEELADRSGLSVRAIANMERGRTARPHRHSVQSLVDALGLRESERLQLDRTSRVLDSDVNADFAPARQGPHQLPAAVASFTGRTVELEALSQFLADTRQGSPTTVVITAIGGTAGVGKTALALQWAHQVADRFGDGQLYVNLRGYDADQPVAAGDALAGFLRALGVPGQEIPDEMDERARLFRSMLAGRHVLVVLDNARDGEQVRPLLPGDPGCAAVVTSRDQLAGLVAADGAWRIDLDVLSPADAVALLRSLMRSRANEDPEAALALARLCARLPLALRIAAELAAARPAIPLSDLVAELKADRLDGLDAGDDRARVRTVLSWSYRQLPDDAAKAFALIGLHPGPDLDAHAVAALTGTTPTQARRVLSRLQRASLVQAVGPRRYGMHDLLRAYAREQASAGDAGDEQCRQALTRLFDYYLAAAAAAMDILFPAEANRRPRIAAAAAVVLDMPGETAAQTWLDTERANLVAVIVQCAGHGWPRHAIDIARTLHRYTINGSYLPEAHTIFSHALQAGRGSGDLAAEAEALHGLASIRLKRGHFRDAAANYGAALERYRKCGDRAGEARILQNLGVTEFQLHNHRAAAGYYREAAAAYDDAGDGLGVAGALCGLANAETELGFYDQAAEHLRSALSAFKEAKDQYREARALEGIGELNLRRGRLTEAADVFREALGLYRRQDNPAGVANGLFSLGEVSVRQRGYQQAITYLRQALVLFRQAGDQHGETLTLRILAEALHGQGQSAAARDSLRAALRLAAETGNTYQHASVHRDLAEGHLAVGEVEQASHHWQQAIMLYSQFGAHDEAGEARTRLSAHKAKARR